MNGQIFYTAGRTDALQFAQAKLRELGCVFAHQPDDSVTHLLLDVPSLDPDGTLRGGGSLEEICEKLPEGVTVCGGNLSTPVLTGYKTVDLLKDPLYLAENADITAHCAVKVALTRLPVTLKSCPVLVIGWGRIGKCLARLLRQMGASVTVAARKETDRAMILALGYDSIDTCALAPSLLRYRLIYNTVPVQVLSEDDLAECRPNCLKIDLASKSGMAGKDILWARGLPGKDAPETSGELIARTILRLR